ncbi:hypothetical protein SGPA1_30679 [Streptomyces misionensis JCM 4497]
MPRSWRLRYGRVINEGPTMPRSGGALLCPLEPGGTEYRVPPSSSGLAARETAAVLMRKDNC